MKLFIKISALVFVITISFPNQILAQNNKHNIGELHGGGIVFYVDSIGQHGLICSLTDLSKAQIWSNVKNNKDGYVAASDWNGFENSKIIIQQSLHESSAALLCDDYSNPDFGTGIYYDWYLPSIDELSLLCQTKYQLNKVLDSDGKEASTPLEKVTYWSSTEYGRFNAWFYNFDFGYSNNGRKGMNCHVRAVRAF